MFNNNFYKNMGCVQLEEHSVPAFPPPCNSRRYNQSVNSGNKVVFKRTFYSNDGIYFNLIEAASNGKVKTTPLTMAFSIGKVTFITEIGDHQIKYVHIAGGTTQPFYSIMTYEDYMNEHFYQHMKWIKRCPGCTKKQVNDLIYDQIEKAPKQTAQIYPRQGFIKLADDNYVFGVYSEELGSYAEIMSDSVKMKKLVPLYREKEEIIQRWLSIYASHPTLKFLGLTPIASKLKFLLKENGINFKQMMVVSPSSGVDEDKLKAMLYSFDTKSCPLPLLTLSEKGMLAYLSKIWDSPAVFLDNSFSDETTKIEEPIRTLIRISNGDYGEECIGRNIIAVISGNAGYIAHRISPESVIPLSTEGITLDYSNDYIRNVTNEMESLVIETILSRINDVRSLVLYLIKRLNHNESA